MTNYAQIQSSSAYLSTEFGEQLARKWFGDESVDSLPRFTRGSRKGRIKGVITWSKVVRGGWVRGDRATANGDATGYVETRVGHIFDRKLHELENSMHGYFPGKVIRDLEKEKSIEEYRRNRISMIDEQIRRYDYERSVIENSIIALDINAKETPQVLEICQNIIKEKNEDISCLVQDLNK